MMKNGLQKNVMVFLPAIFSCWTRFFVPGFANDNDNDQL
jgi:hypothetical protein